MPTYYQLDAEEKLVIDRMRKEKSNPYIIVDAWQAIRDAEVKKIIDTVSKGDYDEVTEWDNFGDRYANNMDGSNDRDDKNWGFGS